MKKSGEVLASGWMSLRRGLKDLTPVIGDDYHVRVYGSKQIVAQDCKQFKVHIIRADKGRKRK